MTTFLDDENNPAPDDGHRGGETYRAEFDYDRLNRQAKAVWACLANGEWWSLAALERRTGAPQASVSARIRDLRKERFGSHLIEARYIANGLWRYRWVGRK